MESKIKVAFAGLGNRGKDAYLPAFMGLKDPVVEIATVADIDPEKLKDVAEKYNLSAERCFSSAEELLAQPKLADAICITTMDRQHYGHVIAAIKKGYDVLLEKPISPFAQECREIQQLAKEYGTKVVVCHVLRYTVFYKKLKELVDKGTIGDVVTIMAIENVGYYHQAHSFVRGNWANSDTASPMILQKCCHDMDLYLWIANKSCKRVSSFGGIYFFDEAHKPEGAAQRCMDGCKAKENCPFDAEKIYLDHYKIGVKNGNTGWPNEVLALHPTVESITKAIQEGPYGKCVFSCDNNVVDHQVVNLEMTDGSTMSFTMTGFTEHNTRYAKIMGTKGEIVADLNTKQIVVNLFGQQPTVYDMTEEMKNASGHAGGDTGLVKEFVEYLCTGELSGGLTSLDVSMESHYAALAAEKSRLQGGAPVDLAEVQ